MRSQKSQRFTLSINKLPLILAAYYMLIVNVPIWSAMHSILSALDSVKIGFVISIPIFFAAAFHFIFQVFNWPYFSKPFFIFLLLTSSMVSFVMFNYGIYVDYGMIENVFETNPAEASSYLSAYSVAWFVLMGLAPAALLLFTPLSFTSVSNFISWKIVGMLISLAVIGIIAALYYKDYASVGRNNSYLKKMIIPTEYLVSTFKYIDNTYLTKPIPYKEIGLDAKQDTTALQASKPTLLMFIVGETARVYNYQLHGYAKPTNAYTIPFHPIFFQNVTSCGTATAVSVPCMFSQLNRDNYDKPTAYNQDNVIDILKRAGIEVTWWDHDGGDKGVAHHIKKMTLLPNRVDPLCNNEHCFDTALLEHFDQETANLTQNTVMFYHIMGSHGPTYFERYPESHRKFVPDCPHADIENCSNEELVNTYDNTILFTDYFISKAIEDLKSVSDKYNTALIYISDHGESLGENGIYLHGMPYSVAPKEQTHIPLMMWFSEGFIKQKQLSISCLTQHAKADDYSQDNVFDSLLGIMDVDTQAYRVSQDIFAPCRQ